MTNEPSSPAALEAVIRQARYLVFAFDGPIRRVMTGTSEDPAAVATPPTPHIQEALAACRESGRSAAIISASPPADVWAYLNAHDLSTQFTAVAAEVPRGFRTVHPLGWKSGKVKFCLDRKRASRPNTRTKP